MKTLNMRRALSAVLAGLALAVITQVSCAARDVANETEIAGIAEASQVSPAPTIAEPRRAGRGSPLTLYVEDSSGNAFLHDQGAGWRYVFIDGPSGFTFVWDREGGWKFVGKIADRNP